VQRTGIFTSLYLIINKARSVSVVRSVWFRSSSWVSYEDYFVRGGVSIGSFFHRAKTSAGRSRPASSGPSVPYIDDHYYHDVRSNRRDWSTRKTPVPIFNSDLPFWISKEIDHDGNTSILGIESFNVYHRQRPTATLPSPRPLQGLPDIVTTAAGLDTSAESGAALTRLAAHIALTCTRSRLRLGVERNLKRGVHTRRPSSTPSRLLSDALVM
jgi:hypothetical protein